jgi:hypothetical protein
VLVVGSHDIAHGIAVRVEREVDVGIHKSGQQRGIAEIDNVGVRWRVGPGQVDVGDAGTLE